MSIQLERAIELIEEKREKDNKKLILSFEEEPELLVLNGRWGPYISYKGNNYKIPKNKEAATLSLDECRELTKTAASKSSAKAGKKTAGKSTGAKKTKKTTRK